MPACEQRPEQHELGVAGVLVFVEQHHLVPGPLGDADLGMPLGDPRGEGHLIAVVHDLPRRLGRLIRGDQREHLLAHPLAAEDLQHRRREPPALRHRATLRHHATLP